MQLELGLIKEVVTAVAALQSSPMVLLSVVALAALLVAGLAIWLVGKKP
ncbi:MAG: hypothetical protein JSS56_15690 [Proteobacteria bacterium]|nr:hypothetical protein [Pseudomonadota bacterium]